MMKQSDGSTAEVGHPVLKAWEAEYRAGKKEALPKIVAYCLVHKKDPPDWAKKAFITACYFGEGPWESDFGRRPKRKDTMKSVKQILKSEAVYDRVEELRKTSTVDPALFELVGKEFNVSAGTASALYYSPATRGAIADRDADRVIDQAMVAEIGPDADNEARVRWWEQNAERIQEITDHTYRAAHEKRPRKPKRIISKKSRRKN
jgi:hypothetical protein